MCRGLCTVIRSEAGQVPGGGGGGGDADSENPDRRRRDYQNNQHLFDLIGGERPVEGGPSRHVGYYDAASLYPSSGKTIALPASLPPPTPFPDYRRAQRGEKKTPSGGRPPLWGGRILLQSSLKISTVHSFYRTV